jgi:integrase
MRLSDLLRLYLTATPLAASTRYLVRRSIERVIETLGDREIREIDDAAVLLLRQTLDASGVLSRAEASCKWLRALLRLAWKMRLLDDLPRVWPGPLPPAHLPDSWSAQEMRRLYIAASNLPGRVGRVPARLWWTAWISVAWDTALRVSQMFRLTWDDVGQNCRWLVVRYERGTKSYRPQCKPLHDDTAQLLRRMGRYGRQGQLFAWYDWPRSRREFFVYFRLLCQQAGLPVERRRLQLTHRLRRTTITAAAQRSLDAAQKHAGHASLATTLRSYIDPRRIQGEVPVPPIARARDRRRA